MLRLPSLKKCLATFDSTLFSFFSFSLLLAPDGSRSHHLGFLRGHAESPLEQHVHELRLAGLLLTVEHAGGPALAAADGIHVVPVVALVAELEDDLLQVVLLPKRVGDGFQEPLRVHHVVHVVVHVQVRPAHGVRLRQRHAGHAAHVRQLLNLVVKTHHRRARQSLTLELVNDGLRDARELAFLEVERDPGRRGARDDLIRRAVRDIRHLPVTPSRDLALRLEPGLDLDLVAPERVLVHVDV
mmetsp:Transcript_1236/g.4970  ORF Transcript_1236/g.4970 Transcript_1236/m.4970 type:complete len:242 (+) Transcript_1236:94-819(+)